MDTFPKAVLFDCDGVLVDSGPVSNRVLRDDLAGRGLDLPLDQVMSIFVGATMESVAAEAERQGANLPDDWVNLFYAKMFAALKAEVEAVPGVDLLLDRLEAAGVACAVGSNGPKAKMEITLSRTGLLARLDPHIYSARDLERPKPAPDVYLHAARKLGVATRHCVVVEDSASGARAAKAAGMFCIGFGPQGQSAQLAPHCDVTLDDMMAVASYLGV